MDSKDIVRRLVVGSDAIDRMRKEIDSVVSSVLGLVMKKHEVNSWHGEFSKKYRMERFFSPEFPGCEWRLVVSDVLYPFHVSCHLNIGFGEASMFAHNSHRVSDISLSNVQRVHESLPLFVEGMRKTFPFLEGSWQPFLDAADYAEKNGW